MWYFGKCGMVERSSYKQLALNIEETHCQYRQSGCKILQTLVQQNLRCLRGCAHWVLKLSLPKFKNVYHHQAQEKLVHTPAAWWRLTSALGLTALYHVALKTCNLKLLHWMDLKFLDCGTHTSNSPIACLQNKFWKKTNPALSEHCRFFLVRSGLRFFIKVSSTMLNLQSGVASRFKWVIVDEGCPTKN